MKKYKTNGQEIEISKPDKILFPGAGITKLDLIEYYDRISDKIIPFLKDRPLMLHRYPNGIEDKDFYQKEEPDYFPDWIDTISVDLKGEKKKQSLVNCNSKATLLYIANQASISPHVWLSRKEQLNCPERVVFDLDPPDDNFDLVKKGALNIKEFFDDLDITVFVMTTGSKGIHVVLPLRGKDDFEQARDFAGKVAKRLADENPEYLTVETRKNKRRGRLFLDYLRNSYGQTSVAPYSIRARSGGPIAIPLSWDELARKDLTARSYHLGNIFRRLSAKSDPWADFHKNRITLGNISADF
jgi:bifunctional non-homologous end joining protein LigD